MKLTKQQLLAIVKEEIDADEVKWISAGGVVTQIEDSSRVYIFKPSNNFGPWSFPKGQVDKGETLKQAALREVEEEIGVKAKIIKYIGKGIGTHSITHFFLMNHTGEVVLDFRGSETDEVLLATWKQAIQLFNKSGNKRDVGIALKAMKMLGLTKQS